MTIARSLDLRRSFTLALIVLAFTAASAAQATFGVLHSFGSTGDGTAPWGRLIGDKQGNLYGTTSSGGAFGGGSVFKLSPPSGAGGWTETILYSFPRSSSDYESPESGLVFDTVGNLYGTTFAGGVSNSGSIFELSPPALSGGAWTETTLFKFSTTTGLGPGGLLRSAAGILYGTTLWGENVYELKPPAVPGGPVKEKTLFTFNSGSNGLEPMYEGSALVSDKAGNLYGTTADGGAFGAGEVFELSPPATLGGPWTETVLYSLGAYPTDSIVSTGGLVIDAAGNLYGTGLAGGTSANAAGTVFQISPPAGPGLPWTETILHNFTGGATDGSAPYAGLVMDKAGNLYGVTYTGGPGNCYFNYPGCGTVFELSPSGGGTWTEAILHTFNGTTDGEFPYAGLMITAGNHLLGANSSGGAHGYGTIFEVVP